MGAVGYAPPPLPLHAQLPGAGAAAKPGEKASEKAAGEAGPADGSTPPQKEIWLIRSVILTILKFDLYF